MSARRTLSARLNVEPLEDRRTPTTATFDGSVLRVYGTDAAETIQLTQDATRINVDGVGSVNAASVKGVEIHAYGGNDTIELRTLRIAATVYGDAGDDFIVGTRANDRLDGGDGNDRVFGMDGNDVLLGGVGNDRLFGMNGGDGLYGQAGADFLDDGNRYGQEFADGGDGSDWNADVVAVNGTRPEDIKQGGAPTCGFLSSLSALAARGTDYRRWISYAGFDSAGTPMYDVSFWNGSAWTKTRVTFDGTLNGTDTNPAAEGESWVVIMQRAWIQFHGEGGRTWPHYAIFALSGRQTDARYSIQDSDFARIGSALAQGKVVLTATNDAPVGSLVERHAYAVVATWGSGSNAWVQVRNPWGRDGRTATDTNPNDGLIWLRWSDFRASMNYLGVA